MSLGKIAVSFFLSTCSAAASASAFSLRSSSRSNSLMRRQCHLFEPHGIAEEALAVVKLLLQEQGLQVRKGTIVDARIIAAPSSTKNAAGAREPEMLQPKRGSQYFFGTKAH